MSLPWSHVRAALLALLLLANGIVALPFGPKVTKQSLARSEAKTELAAWMRLVGPLGVTREEFETFLIDGSTALVELDQSLTAPFKPFMSFTKTGQSWGLFAVPDSDPMRFTLLGIDAAGNERLLYRRLDPDARFLAGAFDFRRVRGVYDCGSDKKKLPPRYTNLAAWAARLAFEAHPDLAKVVVLQTETKTTLPWQPPNARVVERYRLEFERSQLGGLAAGQGAR